MIGRWLFIKDHLNVLLKSLQEQKELYQKTLEEKEILEGQIKEVAKKKKNAVTYVDRIIGYKDGYRQVSTPCHCRREYLCDHSTWEPARIPIYEQVTEPDYLQQKQLNEKGMSLFEEYKQKTATVDELKLYPLSYNCLMLMDGKSQGPQIDFELLSSPYKIWQELAKFYETMEETDKVYFLEFLIAQNDYAKFYEFAKSLNEEEIRKLPAHLYGMELPEYVIKKQDFHRYQWDLLNSPLYKKTKEFDKIKTELIKSIIGEEIKRLENSSFFMADPKCKINALRGLIDLLEKKNPQVNFKTYGELFNFWEDLVISANNEIIKISTLNNTHRFNFFTSSDTKTTQFINTLKKACGALEIVEDPVLKLRA